MAPLMGQGSCVEGAPAVGEACGSDGAQGEARRQRGRGGPEVGKRARSAEV
jgi:hypothetical protein